MTYDITFIVPMYNKEHEIERLINSIINNDSYGEDKIEIVIIDDKSLDNSVKIVSPYLTDNIKLIELENNSGVHIARNTGISNANGKWIIFLDGDDYLSVNGLDEISETFKRYENIYDVIFFSYITSLGDKTGLIKEGNITSLEYLNEYTNDNKFIFRKEKDALYCVKKELLIKNNIKWQYTNLDYIFRNRIVMFAEKFLFVDNAVAVYVVGNINSLTSKRKKTLYKLNISNSKLENQLIYMQEFLEYFIVNDKKVGCKYIKKLFYDFKYSKSRYKYLYEIITIIRKLNCKYTSRFIIITFLPIRTISYLIYFIKKNLS